MLWPLLLLWFKLCVPILTHSTNPVKPYEIWHCIWTMLSPLWFCSRTNPFETLNLVLHMDYITDHFPVAVQTFVLLFHICIYICITIIVRFFFTNCSMHICMVWFSSIVLAFAWQVFKPMLWRKRQEWRQAQGTPREGCLLHKVLRVRAHFIHHHPFL